MMLQATFADDDKDAQAATTWCSSHDDDADGGWASPSWAADIQEDTVLTVLQTPVHRQGRPDSSRSRSTSAAFRLVCKRWRELHDKVIPRIRLEGLILVGRLKQVLSAVTSSFPSLVSCSMLIYDTRHDLFKELTICFGGGSDVQSFGARRLSVVLHRIVTLALHSLTSAVDCHHMKSSI